MARGLLFLSGMRRTVGTANGIGKLLALFAVVASVAGCSGGAPAEEQMAAHAALERWNEMRPAEYTFVVRPEGMHSNVAARIKVKSEIVIENVDANGRSAGYDHYTMTDALLEAIDQAAQEELFKGAYDPVYGYLVWYDVPSPDRNHEAPGRGIDVTCFEASIADGACSTYF